MTGILSAVANRTKLHLHIKLISSFFVGGLLGALGFKTFGFITTLPLSVLLMLLVIRPVLNDARNWVDLHHPDRDH
jgi:uncharacterized membrane protein YoaK (UPF0700 family)